MHILYLDKPETWEWRQSPCKALTPPVEVLSATLDDGWRTCSQMKRGSAIQVELLAAGLIPDPFLGRNEELVQWVGEEDWLYRTSFDVQKPPGSGETAELVFEGLDTFATVHLNGQKILESDNMFIPHRVDVTEKLLNGTNKLVILFTSAFLLGKAVEEQHLGKEKHLTLWNGDPSRLFVRKAGYNYGWDWGPVLMTCGPWKPIRLETFEARIIDFHPVAQVSDKLDATLRFDIKATHDLTTNITVLSPSGDIFRKISLEAGQKASSISFAQGDFELWWSVGLGKQPLYTAKVDLVGSDGKVLDSAEKKFAFRRIKVVQRPLENQPGTTFLFEVNNVPVFAGGSNWIPIDSFATNATRERYAAWLQLLVDGNQNMIRVWAGGYYEDDDFYEICDELGILVWQDFMFGCGAYPAHASFVESVRKEAEAAVLRVRSHPCLAIFAGNNEDYQIAEQAHLEYDPDDKDGDWSKTSFPAREIYERTLPAVVEALSDVFYHPGSPWGGKDTTDGTVGDCHRWDVWHGQQLPYQQWDKLNARFISEFGMQGIPDIRTIDQYLDGDVKERYPQSRTMAAHNKADGYERRTEVYVVENIRHSFEMEDYVYATQLIQAETLSTAYRLFRREFKGPGKEYNAGALVWQLNDVWPCTSWSIVDYFLRPKPSYYSIKQSMAPIAVGMKRETVKKFTSPHSAIFKEESRVDIWVCNSLTESKEAVLVVEAFELLSGERIYTKEEDVTIKSNQATELARVDVPLYKSDPQAAVVVSAKLVDPGSRETLSRFSVYPEPYKYLTFPDEKAVALSIKVDDKTNTITISAARPVKGLILAFSTDVWLSDNALDLIPGDERVLTVKGLQKESKLSWRYLGDSHVP